MKKMYFAFMAMFFVLTISAQNVIQVLNAEQQPKPFEVNLPDTRATYDTLGLNEFFDNATAIYNYLSPNGGYIYGTQGPNSGGFKGNTIAQGYFGPSGGGFGIVGALVWIGWAEVLSANGCLVSVKAALIDGTSTYGPPPNHNDYTINRPNTILATGTFQLADVDTTFAGENGWVTVDFASPVMLGADTDFALIFDASACTASGDTVNVIASDDGVNNLIFGEEYTWYLYPSGTPFWTQLSHVWSTTSGPLTCMPAIFAIVDLDYVNVDEHFFFQGLQLTLSPNPASDLLTVAYGVQNQTKARIEIFDMNGRIVLTSDQGVVVPGSYSTTLNISSLAAGSYVCSIVSDNGRLTKKLLIK